MRYFGRCARATQSATVTRLLALAAWRFCNSGSPVPARVLWVGQREPGSLCVQAGRPIRPGKTLSGNSYQTG